MQRPVHLVIWATAVTQFEFPVWFSHVTRSDPLGMAVLFTRNGLLIAAALIACRILWRQTVTEPRLAEAAAAVPVVQPEREKALSGSF